MNSQDETPAADIATTPSTGVNTYSTGGGGVTFAHRVAATYLASMLTGGRRTETHDLRVTSLGFQTGPTHPVDDLLVTARDGDREVTLAVACRATPNFAPGNAPTVKLVKSLLDELAAHPDGYVAVAVAGWKNEWDQVAKLCDIARANSNANGFQTAMKTKGRWSEPVCARHAQLEKMVQAGLDAAVTDTELQERTWFLLTRLRVVGFRVQSPDKSGWTAVATSLDPVAAATSDGVGLRDRLAVKAGQYDAIGAVVDLNLLRLDTHLLLDAPSMRTKRPWGVLDGFRDVAFGLVRGALGGDIDGATPLELPFVERCQGLAAQMRQVAAGQGALVVTGASGTGKSSLVLSTVASLEATDAGAFEAIVINFRELPNTSAELQHMLGVPLAQVMAELSAPSRVLVIDAADAAVERSSGLLRGLLASASNAGLGVVAVTADPAAEFVREQLNLGRQEPAQAFDVTPLDDEELAQVAEHFPLLRGLLRNLTPTSLLRRLVVLDLLSRTGLTLDNPISEWACLELIWRKVVRGDGRPNRGSPQAREEAVLALAAAELFGTQTSPAASSLNPTALDSLRADHLLAPQNIYRSHPRFAHDEVRRYAIAIHLVRSGRIIETLQAADVPRWALSAVTLACKGHLADPTLQPEAIFQDLVSGFNAVARSHGARWADVPLEAVLETPSAYECIKGAVDTKTVELKLPDVLRVVQQRFSFAGLIDPALGTPVVRYLIDHEQPWNISEDAFEVLANWLLALVVANQPAGHELRQALRTRLLTFWAKFPRREDVEDDLPKGMPGRRRRRQSLDYNLTDPEFVETMALLGTDINTDIEQCLNALAKDAPGFLAPAADAPGSARSIVQHDPELLATLMEAYYIDQDADGSWGHHDKGIRSHQGRWTHFGPPFSAYYFGGFWQLFNAANLTTSVRVLNNVLNHAARIRVETTSRLRRSFDGFDPPRQEPGTSTEDDEDSTGFTLNLTGEARNYVGDGHVWTWYRGTSSGPNPCMSALQAMERIAEQLLSLGATPDAIAGYLFNGCENLATPGLLYGLFARNINDAGTQLDPFLAEPAVWSLEFSRVGSEHYGFRAASDGLANPERYRWTPPEMCFWLMTHADEERRTELRAVGDALVANGVRQGLAPDHTMNWAANLDESRYKFTKHGDNIYLEVVPPPEVRAAQADIIAQQEQVQVVLRLQNRYWGSARYQDDGYEPPTVAEIAEDLAAAHALLDTKRDDMLILPFDGAAQVARAAVERAANGEPEALGDQGAFVVEFLMAVAATFQDSDDMSDEGQLFDLGADRSTARALPALLTQALAPALAEAGVTTADVAEAGLAMAGKAPLETRLFLARGCDPLWASPCAGGDCIHQAALAWVIETARGAEIGPWDSESQSMPRVKIEGDVTARLKELDGESVDVGVLDSAIRALGVASTTTHCVTNDAKQLLADLLAVQRNAMVKHEAKGWTADDRGMHTLVAARALLQTYSTTSDPAPILDHLDILRRDAGLLVNILHGLAAAGAENNTLADAAKSLWPELLTHALTYATDAPNVYRERTWGPWAAAALLPNPLTWTQGMNNELTGPPIDWVEPAHLTHLVDGWLPIARGEMRCVDALIGFVRRLPAATQATQGLAWITDLCVQGGEVLINRSEASNEWMKEVRPDAEEHDTLQQWQALVDALVVAGNTGLAPYST